MHQTQYANEDEELDALVSFPEESVDEALTYAAECIAAAQKLSAAIEGHLDLKMIAGLSIATESYINKFNIPIAALEAEESDIAGEAPNEKEKPLEEKQRSRTAKVISYLYAAVKRIFQFFFDFARNQKSVARKIIPKTKELIGRIDQFDITPPAGKIKEKGLVNALHMDGIAPRRPTAIFEQLVAEFEQVNRSSGISEMAAVLSSAKTENFEKFKTSSQALHNVLENGMKSFMNVVGNPGSHPAFRTTVEGRHYYSTDVMFGQHYVAGSISDLDEDGKFFFKAGIYRDADVPIRIESLPLLRAEEIRQVCRTALRLSELVIQYSRDEDLMQRLMREASYFITKEAKGPGVAALSNFLAMANNHYFAYLRYITRTMRQLMRWAELSVQAYEAKKNAQT